MVSVLEQRVKVFAWEELSYSFLPLDDTKVRPQGGVYYAEAVVDDDMTRQNMPVAPLVYTLYDDVDRAELAVEDIVFSRLPALPGEPVHITAHLRNTGVVHAHDVQVRFSVNSIEFYIDTVDLLAGAEDATVVTATYNVADDTTGVALYRVGVLVDPHGYVVEDDETDNLYEEEMYVVRPTITVSSFATTTAIVAVTMVMVAALVVIRERKYRKKR